MRGKEANAGSLRVLLLILALLVANLFASTLSNPERSAAQPKDPATERAGSLGKNSRTQELAASSQRRFVEVQREPSAALGMTAELKP